ncbi:hypothetical protein QCE73_33050 [Caballeronia sp. LZ029]|uniref:hypothetical protein n=1 Tax=Caballeronia sp. LZ029 TaxID=3038564 RepID=UPI002855BFCA|nr:hypothetical protein [Caballeronia sp. LZ029]MDR5748021.1 hypothetical protein [Caballeronia sp. LZ029]
MARRQRGRIEAILDRPVVKGFREPGVNPAAWRDNLDKLLAAPKKAKRVRNHPALAIDAMPAFIAGLRTVEGIGARRLEFAILTAARSGDARGATFAEIDRRRLSGRYRPNA